MGHVHEAPRGRDLADTAMKLERVVQGPVAAFQPPRLNEPDNRGSFLRQQCVRLTHAHPDGGGNGVRLKRRIVETSFDRGMYVQKGACSSRRKIWPFPLTGLRQ
jgi:hypothetical protein